MDGIRMREVTTLLAEEGVRYFTISDLARRFGLAPHDAAHLGFRLARTNRARRLKRGLYALLALEDRRDTQNLPGNWYLAAAAIAGDDPYFLAYHTAMELHGMTADPLRTIYVATPKQRRTVVQGNATFRFVTVAAQRFFGLEDREVEPVERVHVSDLERTLVDAVDRPELCGGLEEVFRGIRRRRADIGQDRLLRYLLQFDGPVVIKRLGFLLEAAGYDDPTLLWEMERIVPRLRHYVPLDKTLPDTGGQNKRWELRLNVDVGRLIGSART